MSHAHILNNQPPPPAGAPRGRFDPCCHDSWLYDLERALSEDDAEKALSIVAAAKPTRASLILMAKSGFHQGIASTEKSALPVDMWLDALFSAASEGRAACVEAILTKLAPEMRARRHARAASAALLAAAVEGRFECAAILAPFFVKIPGIGDVLHHCARMGALECVQILAELPGSKGALVRAFFIAAHHGQVQCAEFLTPKFSGAFGRLALAAAHRGFGSLASQASLALFEGVSSNRIQCIHLLLPLVSQAAAKKSFFHAALLGRGEALSALLPRFSCDPDTLAAGLAHAAEFNQQHATAMIKAFQERAMLVQELAAPLAPPIKNNARL